MIQLDYQFPTDRPFELDFFPEDGPASGDVTVSIRSASGETILEETSVVLGAVDTGAVTVRDSAEITLTSAVGVSRGRYWLERPPGDGYPVELRGVAGSVAYMRSPALASETCTLLSWRLAVTVPSVSTIYRSAVVEWALSATDKRLQIIDIVPNPFGLEISQRMLATIEPELRSLGGSRQEILQIREGALIEIVQALKGLQPDRIVDRRRLERPACMFFLALHHARDRELSEYYRDLAARGVQAFFDSASGDDGGIWYDSDDDMLRDTSSAVDDLGESENRLPVIARALVG